MASSAETSCLFYLVLYVAYNFEKIYLQTYFPHKIGITLPQGWFIKFLGVLCFMLQNVTTYMTERSACIYVHFF
jgi:hypothetical protein